MVDVLSKFLCVFSASSVLSVVNFSEQSGGPSSRSAARCRGVPTSPRRGTATHRGWLGPRAPPGPRRDRPPPLRPASAASGPELSTSTRYSATSAKRRMTASRALGCRLLPRRWIISSVRPRMPPSRRRKAAPARAGPRIDSDQVAGAITQQRTAPPAEVGQHQLAQVAGRDGLPGSGVDDLGHIVRLQYM